MDPVVDLLGAALRDDLSGLQVHVSWRKAPKWPRDTFLLSDVHTLGCRRRWGMAAHPNMEGNIQRILVVPGQGFKTRKL